MSDASSSEFRLANGRVAKLAKESAKARAP
jgi:hypothetical protein